MKRNFALLLLLFSTSLSSYSQSWQWLNHIGGPGSGGGSGIDEYIVDAVVDSAGNSYVCGNLFQGANLNSTPLANSGCFIAKFNCSGQVVWHHEIGGSASGGDGRATGIALDKFGNLYLSAYIAGVFPGLITLLDTTYSSIYYNTVIIRMDTSGNRKWVWFPGNDPSVYCVSRGASVYSLRTDDSGYLYFAGVTSDTCEAFPGHPAVTAPCIAKMDSLKNLIWLHNLDVKFPLSYFYSYSNGNTSPNHFYVDGNGNSYFTGDFNDTIVVNGNTIVPVGTNGEHNFFAAKYDSSGNYAWHYVTGGPMNRSNHGNTIKTDPLTNDVWIATHAGTGTQFGAFTVTNTYSSSNVAAAVRLNQGGGVLGLYLANIQFSSGDPVVDIMGDKAYFCSSFNGKVKIGTDSLNGGTNGDLFLAEIDIPTGQVHLLTGIQGTGNDEIPTTLTHDLRGNLYMGGAFDGTITFNSNNITYGGGVTDAFIAKWGTASCTPLGMNKFPQGSHDGLLVYPNPAAEEISIRFSKPAGENAEFTIYNATGSVVYHRHSGASQERVSVKEFPAGIYLVQSVTRGKIYSAKFIRE